MANPLSIIADLSFTSVVSPAHLSDRSSLSAQFKCHVLWGRTFPFPITPPRVNSPLLCIYFRCDHHTWQSRVYVSFSPVWARTPPGQGLCLIHLHRTAPGSVSAIVQGLSKCLLIEKVPRAGHSDGIKDGEGVSPYSQEEYNVVGPGKTWL